MDTPAPTLSEAVPHRRIRGMLLARIRRDRLHYADTGTPYPAKKNPRYDRTLREMEVGARGGDHPSAYPPRPRGTPYEYYPVFSDRTLRWLNRLRGH